jgi:hypothetical protein
MGDLSPEQMAARMRLTDADLREAVTALSLRANRADSDPQLDPQPMRQAAIRIAAAVLAEPVPDSIQPKRCPTCGSDDPEHRARMVCGRPGNEIVGPPCADDFHKDSKDA